MEQFEQSLNDKIKNVKKISNIVNCVAIIILLIFIILFRVSILNRERNIIVFLPFIVATLMIITKTCYKNKIIKEIKNEIIIKILPSLFETDKFIHNPKGMAEALFKKSNIYKDYTDYYTSDEIKTYSGDLNLANVKVFRKEGEGKIEVFTGIFGYIQTKDYYKDEILIKPDIQNAYVKTFMDEVNKFSGDFSDTVRLENSEFEKNFEVYSKNQIEARKILTPYYMERLLKAKQELNTLIKILYKDNKKYIAIWNKRILDEKELYNKEIKIEPIKKHLKDIINLFYDN